MVINMKRSFVWENLQVGRMHTAKKETTSSSSATFDSAKNSGTAAGDFPELRSCVGDGEARADRQRGELIDGVTAGAKIGRS
jgi:hypothetical protein